MPVLISILSFLLSCLLSSSLLGIKTGIHHHGTADASHEEVCTLDEFVHHGVFHDAIISSAGQDVFNKAITAAKTIVH